MVKRIAMVVLWFIAVGAIFEYATLITGVSSIVGVVVAVAVSAFVGIDPLGLIWITPRRSDRPRPATSPQARRAVQPH
jgi:hypothetical protein